jgi:hypothetical protein
MFKKIQYVYLLKKIYIKWGVWRVAVCLSYIWDARFLKVNVWVCVCVGFVMWECFGICVLVFCVVCTVFLYCFVYVYLFLFVLSGLV